jgi:hypothetical protein
MSDTNTNATAVRRDPTSKGQPDALRNVLAKPDASAEPFANDAEMRAAMSDPRYRESAEYRASVVQRINAGMQARQAKAPSTPGSEPSLYPGSGETYRYNVPDQNREVSVSRALEALDVQPFTTRAERNQAFSDPRYQRDGAYRALVAARLSITDTNKLL